MEIHKKVVNIFKMSLKYGDKIFISTIKNEKKTHAAIVCSAK